MANEPATFRESSEWVALCALGIVCGSSVLAAGIPLIAQPIPSSPSCEVECVANVSQASASWAGVGISGLALLATLIGIVFVRASLREARNATRIASEQVRLSRHALISTERAMVFYQGVKYLSYRRDDGSIIWGLTVIAGNSGATPATSLRLSINSRLADTPLPDDWLFEVPPATSELPMAPGSSLHTGEIRVEPEDILMCARGERHFHIWGTVAYRDVFEDTPSHETRFCVALTAYGGNPAEYYDEDTNPVQLFFTNQPRNYYFD